MKTFSIALGSFTFAPADPGPGSEMRQVGTPPLSIADKERLEEEEEREKLGRRFAAGLAGYEGEEADERVALEEEWPGQAPEGEGTGTGTAATGGAVVAEGDVLEFAVDPENYAECLLIVHHADGSSDTARFHRNAFLLRTEHQDAPVVEPVAEAEEEPVTETEVAS